MHLSSLQRLGVQMALTLVFSLLTTIGALSIVTASVLTNTASFQDALDRATSSYKSRGYIESKQRRTERALEQEEEKLSDLMEQKRTARLEVALLSQALEVLNVDFAARNTPALSPQNAMKNYLHSKPLFVDALHRSLYGKPMLSSVQRRHTTVLNVARALAHEQVKTVANDLSATLVATEDSYEQLLDETEETQQTVDQFANAVQRNQAEIRSIQAITRDVHEQVLKLQSELARIDAKLRAKAERSLLAKGLLDPDELGKKPQLRASATKLSWPARGRISAGFLNHGYRQFFGVAHHGIDIVVGERSPVHSAADGVVFLVRDGGATGYTYVLIGHRNGVATLYGHLDTVTVSAGQEVRSGQMIGLSGGRPGSRGSGPLTTGAHLHFEVIVQGENVDPLSMLDS